MQQQTDVFLLQTLGSLQTDMSELRTDVTAIKLALAERKGERRVALWLVGTASGFCGAVGTAMLTKWLHLP